MTRNLLKELTQVRELFETELFEQVIPFWEKYSVDWVNGGYYNCLDRDGRVYDTTKYVWLQAREAWTFSKLYRKAKPNPYWLKIAKNGIDFLRSKTIRPDGRVYFRVSQEGLPVTLQRKIFSECFYVMALAEYSRASGDDTYLKEARVEFEKVWMFAKDQSLVGRPFSPGMPAMQNLAIPMILLNLIEELTDGSLTEYREQVDECIVEMLEHVHFDRKLVFENVGLKGEFLDNPEGRHLNPGHAIEAGWFLQNWAQRLGDRNLSQTATQMVRWSHQLGWDQKHGGYFYFLDSEGYSPTQLEWNMKLWWPHNEAMIGHLLNYKVTGDLNDFDQFIKVKDYSFAHFKDQTYGEWYGYLNQSGEVNQRFKGGPYKCCFHLPRSLLVCSKLLQELELKCVH